MTADYSTLVLCRDYYNDEVEFWSQVGQAVKLLLNAEKTIRIRFDEKSLGVLVIEFNPEEEELGDAMPRWLTPEEWELILDYRYDQKHTESDTEDETR